MKKIIKSIIIIALMLIGYLLDYFGLVNYTNTNEHKINYKKEKLHEKDYVKLTCTGQIEYVLEDSTRVDCLSEEYAIEYDWAKKWAESVGQSLYYAKMTGRKPAVALILESERDEKYVKKIEKLELNIKIFKIYANNINN